MVEVRQIQPDELAYYVKKAMESEKEEEAKFIIMVESLAQKSGTSVFNKWYEVVLGDIEEVLLHQEHRENGSDYEQRAQLAIIPLTVPVVIRVIEDYRGWDGDFSAESLLVFTSSGWKRIDI